MPYKFPGLLEELSKSEHLQKNSKQGLPQMTGALHIIQHIDSLTDFGNTRATEEQVQFVCLMHWFHSQWNNTVWWVRHRRVAQLMKVWNSNVEKNHKNSGCPPLEERFPHDCYSFQITNSRRPKYEKKKAPVLETFSTTTMTQCLSKPASDSQQWELPVQSQVRPAWRMSWTA